MLKGTFFWILMAFIFLSFHIGVCNAQTIKIEKYGNLRSGPSKNEEIIGKVTIGTEVTQVEKSGVWYKINLPDGKVGWIHHVLLTKEGNLIVWDKLVDKHNVKGRKLQNKIVMEIIKNHPLWGSGYLVSGKDNSNLKMILGADSPFSTESGTMGVKTFSGSIKNNSPDSKFYSVLGIGTSIGLPNQWIKIFGVEIKGGNILIQKSGIKYSKSEMRR